MLKNIYTKTSKMKKIITLLLVFVCTISFGQDFERKAERVKALRVAFISSKLDLTSQEAEKFWPIFNKFDEKQIVLHKQKRQLKQTQVFVETDRARGQIELFRQVADGVVGGHGGRWGVGVGAKRK